MAAVDSGTGKVFDCRLGLQSMDPPPGRTCESIFQIAKIYHIMSLGIRGATAFSPQHIGKIAASQIAGRVLMANLGNAVNYHCRPLGMTAQAGSPGEIPVLGQTDIEIQGRTILRIMHGVTVGTGGSDYCRGI